MPIQAKSFIAHNNLPIGCTCYFRPRELIHRITKRWSGDSFHLFNLGVLVTTYL